MTDIGIITVNKAQTKKRLTSSDHIFYNLTGTKNNRDTHTVCNGFLHIRLVSFNTTVGKRQIIVGRNILAVCNLGVIVKLDHRKLFNDTIVLPANIGSTVKTHKQSPVTIFHALLVKISDFLCKEGKKLGTILLPEQSFAKARKENRGHRTTTSGKQASKVTLGNLSHGAQLFTRLHGRGHVKDGSLKAKLLTLASLSVTGHTEKLIRKVGEETNQLRRSHNLILDLTVKLGEVEYDTHSQAPVSRLLLHPTLKFRKMQPKKVRHCVAGLSV